MSDLPLPPPEGDMSDEVVGNGSQPFRRVDEQREKREAIGEKLVADSAWLIAGIRNVGRV